MGRVERRRVDNTTTTATTRARTGAVAKGKGVILGRQRGGSLLRNLVAAHAALAHANDPPPRDTTVPERGRRRGRADEYSPPFDRLISACAAKLAIAAAIAGCGCCRCRRRRRLPNLPNHVANPRELIHEAHPHAKRLPPRPLVQRRQGGGSGSGVWSVPSGDGALEAGEEGGKGEEVVAGGDPEGEGGEGGEVEEGGDGGGI